MNSRKLKRSPGRPPNPDRQLAELTTAIKKANTAFRQGVTKLGENFEDVMDVALEVALGKKQITVVDKLGYEHQITAPPSVPMLTTLINKGFEYLSETGEETSEATKLMGKLTDRVVELRQDITNNYNYGNPTVTVEADSRGSDEESWYSTST